MHEIQKHCMQVAGLWKVPKMLKFLSFLFSF
jgi:hypothetical protein